MAQLQSILLVRRVNSHKLGCMHGSAAIDSSCATCQLAQIGLHAWLSCNRFFLCDVSTRTNWAACMAEQQSILLVRRVNSYKLGCMHGSAAIDSSCATCQLAQIGLHAWLSCNRFFLCDVSTRTNWAACMAQLQSILLVRRVNSHKLGCMHGSAAIDSSCATCQLAQIGLHAWLSSNRFFLCDVSTRTNWAACMAQLQSILLVRRVNSHKLGCMHGSAAIDSSCATCQLAQIGLHAWLSCNRFFLCDVSTRTNWA